MADAGLRQLLSANIRGHWQSVETGSTGKGVPDANYCIDGVEGWVECKWTRAWAVGVEPEQVAWAERRMRNGGRVWFAVRRKDSKGARKLACDELWIVHPSGARVLMTEGLRGAHRAGKVQDMWEGGPARWPWPALAYLLAGPAPRPG
jgi:hypothetical protein